MKYLLKSLPTFLVFLLVFLFLTQRLSFGISQDECKQKAEHDELGSLGVGDLEVCANIFNQSLQSVSSQRVSLESEVKRFNTAILITSTNILTTTKQIDSLEKEINSLDNKIGQLDVSLNQVSVILARRIAETYKKGKVDYLNIFLSSKNLSEFVNRFKYLRVIQLHDRSLMLQMETAKTDFEDQKNLKEQKQTELETAKKKLESQKTLLAQQKAAKDNLLAITKNDEKKYQQLQAKVQTRLAAFQTFVSSQGAVTILSNQTKCDDWGCYYSQRDSLWGNMFLGGSSYLMKNSGCFITSVAMMASHSGKDIKPNDIAQLPAAITSGGDLKWSFSINSINISISSASKSELDQRLNEGKPVIAGLCISCKEDPNHFIVIKEKRGNDYVMYDPFLENGGNGIHLLSEKYNISNIASLRFVSF